MPLVFLDEASERGGPTTAVRLAEFFTWYPRAADDERWDVRLSFATKAASQAAAAHLGVAPQRHTTLETSLPQGRARSVVREVLALGQVDSLKVTAGPADGPMHVTLDLPRNREEELDRGPRVLGAVEPPAARAELRFWDWTSVVSGASPRIRRAYDAAAACLGVAEPFDAWAATAADAVSPVRGIRCPASTRGIPNAVGVDGGGCSSEERARLLESWLALLPAALHVEVHGRLPEGVTRDLLADEASRLASSNSWLVDTTTTDASPGRELVMAAFQDPAVVRGLRDWQLRARSVRWRLPDRSMIAEEWNAVVLCREPHESRRTIRITLALEEVDGARFRQAIGVLRASLPADVERPGTWIPIADPEGSERGKTERIGSARLAEAAQDFLYRRAGGLLSDVVRSSRRPVGEGADRGPVEIKRALLGFVGRELPSFSFDAERSRIAAKGWRQDRYSFVRRNPSGTWDLVEFTRDRDPCARRVLRIRVGVSSVGGGYFAPPWGLEMGTENLGWTELPCPHADGLARALDGASKRVRKDFLAFFDELEPRLAVLRALVRQ